MDPLRPKEEEIKGTIWPSTSTTKPNIHGKKFILCIWWDQLVLWVVQIERPLLRLSTEHNWWDWALKEKRAHYYSRHDKIILLHDNARPHVAAPVKTYLETNGKFYPTRRILQILFLPTTACSNRWRMACLSSTSHHMKISKIVSMIR